MDVEVTQAVLGITPRFLCWISLISVIVGLIVGGFFTNITAFARQLRRGRKPTGGYVERTGE